MSDDDTAEFTATYVWRALSHDGDERRNLGGVWYPSWIGRFGQGAMQRDFDSLDRPGWRGRLEGPAGELVENRPVARWMTLQDAPELNLWALAHYGPSIVQPFGLP